MLNLQMLGNEPCHPGVINPEKLDQLCCPGNRTGDYLTNPKGHGMVIRSVPGDVPGGACAGDPEVAGAEVRVHVH